MLAQAGLVRLAAGFTSPFAVRSLTHSVKTSMIGSISRSHSTGSIRATAALVNFWEGPFRLFDCGNGLVAEVALIAAIGFYACLATVKSKYFLQGAS
jgi:hypothetical protein